jgi:hypothetical protein
MSKSNQREHNEATSPCIIVPLRRIISNYKFVSLPKAREVDLSPIANSHATTFQPLSRCHCAMRYALPQNEQTLGSFERV